MLGRLTLRPALTASIVVLLLGTALPLAPVAAAAPPPALTGCLAQGSFLLQDDACSTLRPIQGDQFGPITSVQVVQVPASGSVQLAYPGGDDIDFDKPQGACGENGCPKTAVIWRVAGSGQGVGMSECGSRDARCTVSIAPGLGDAGEDYRVVFVQRYVGIRPQDGVAFALYAPPQLYPIRVDTITPSGKAYHLDSGDTAYAVRDGTGAVQASCVASDWWIAASRQTRIDPPACITLAAGGEGSATAFTGVLPDTGSWTITGSPAGELQEPIGSRPTPFDRKQVIPASDDIWIAMDHHDRPAIEVDMAPATTMDLGTTQDVTLTLRAADGDDGSIPSITFSVPEGIEAVPGPDTALSVGMPAGGIPGDLALLPNQTRTITVPVTAVGLGTTILRVTVNAIDDVGGASIDGVSVPITVGLGDAATGEGPSPVITYATDLPSTFADTIAGTIAGTPGSHVTVSLASSLRAIDGSCSSEMSGDGVQTLGSVAVDIGTDGSGAFALTGRLGPGLSVRGLAVADGVISSVGDCFAVRSTDPAISIPDTEVTEPTGTKSKPTRADVTVPIVLSDPSESPVSVTIATMDGSAIAPDDYAALAPTVVTFAPGETRHDLAITVVGDGRKDDGESLQLTMSAPAGGHLDPEEPGGSVIIRDPEQDAASARGGMTGWYTIQAKEGSVKHGLRVTRHDAASGRLEITIPSASTGFPDGKITGTLQDGRFRGSLRTKRWVPVDYDCTVSTPGGVTTFTCEVDQPKYHNLKHEHYQVTWEHE